MTLRHWQKSRQVGRVDVVPIESATPPIGADEDKKTIDNGHGRFP